MSRMKRHIGRDDILDAMRNTVGNRAAARYLNCSYDRYQKYAKLYTDENGVTLWDKHKRQVGSEPVKHIEKYLPYFKDKKIPPTLSAIASGKVSALNYNPQKLKQKFLETGLLKSKCYCCGFKEKRLVDGKMPLILIHRDGNKKNWTLDNLELLCYNCAFLQDKKSPVTQKFVEKEEDFVDRSTYKEQNEAWQLDDYQREFLKNLGIRQDDVKSYEKYISRL